MKLTQRRVVSIQVLPVIILADTIVPQFAGADEHTTAYGVYKRMNDNMCSWHEDHADPISANNQAMKLAATYGVFIEGHEFPKQWLDLANIPATPPEPHGNETKPHSGEMASQTDIPTPGYWYTTKPGDTLRSIAHAAYGMYADILEEAIRFRNQKDLPLDQLLPVAGTTIQIPVMQHKPPVRPKLRTQDGFGGSVASERATYGTAWKNPSPTPPSSEGNNNSIPPRPTRSKTT